MKRELGNNNHSTNANPSRIKQRGMSEMLAVCKKETL